MKNEHTHSMVKLAHRLAGIAPREGHICTCESLSVYRDTPCPDCGETPVDQGAATINVTLSKGVLTVKHGDTGEVLLSRPVKLGFWSFTLWPTLDGRRS